MKVGPARGLKGGDLVLGADSVTRLHEDPTINGDSAYLAGYDNRTKDPSWTIAPADEPLHSPQTLVKRVGKSRIEMELAGVDDPYTRPKWIYRHRVFDDTSHKIADGLGPSAPPRRPGVDESIGPDNERALAAFTSFLLDDARRLDKIDRGEWVEDALGYDESLLRWAQENSGALEQLHDELDPRAMELE